MKKEREDSKAENHKRGRRKTDTKEERKECRIEERRRVDPRSSLY